MTKPLVTVLTPAYNVEKYISEAIESILKQSYSNFEFIIIDDKSTDNTSKIIKEYKQRDSRIKLIFNKENLKLSRTLNKGLNIAQGKYIIRFDADDISYPTRIEKQVKLMETKDDVGISGGTMVIINSSGRTIGKREYHLTDKKIRSKIFRYSPFCHPAIIIRRSVLRKSGLYNPDFNPAEDYELYFRIGKHAKFANLPDKLIKYRILDNSMTSKQIKEMESQTIKARRMYYQSYKATMVDKLYTNLLQLMVSFPIISAKRKLWLFTKVRKIL